MVMGNANVRKNGGDCSGDVNKLDEGFEQHFHGDPMDHSPSQQSCDDLAREEMRPVMITWSHGGNQVAIEGSWNDWRRRYLHFLEMSLTNHLNVWLLHENYVPNSIHVRELLQKAGKEFTILKVLPSGVYHFRFVVDGRIMCSPDLPLDRDHLGNTCNILDLQEYIPGPPVSMSEFEPPPSPESSYSNEPFVEEDFRKPPPELPPMLDTKFINEAPRSSMTSHHQSLPRPQHVLLNHLLVQSDRGQPVALASTHRFLQKYVKVFLYKPSWR